MRRISPLSGNILPARIFSNVVLPEPKTKMNNVNVVGSAVFLAKNC